MTEPENQEQQPSTEAETTESFKKRDEKGLTLGSRLMLRAMMEHQRILRSASLLRSDTSLTNVLTQETMMDVIDDLLFFARQVGEKAGTVSEVKAYLLAHEEEDTETLRALREEDNRKLHEEYAKRAVGAGTGILGVLAASARQSPSAACDVCGEPKCPSCGGCHHDHKKSEPLN